MVVDFVVGRVLTQDGGQESVTGLDDVTTYYLLHRHDFGLAQSPVGGCILYALSCNFSDSALVNQHDLLAQSGKGRASDELEENDTPEEADIGGGSKVKLKPWDRRRGRNLGLETPGGRPVPLIDQVHKLMHLWRATRSRSTTTSIPAASSATPCSTRSSRPSSNWPTPVPMSGLFSKP